MEETSYLYNVRIDELGDRTMFVNKMDVLSSDEYPLEVYEMSKTDIFGYKDFEWYMVKSDLMDDYVRLEKLK